MRRSHADYLSLKKSGTKIPRRFADLSAKIKLAFYPLGGLKDGRRCGKIDIYSVFCHHGKDCGAANRKTETGANAVRVLFVGDVVSEIGCDFLMRTMPQMKKKHNIDFCIVNGENSALGNGITPASCDIILSAGADAVTGGNHTFRRAEFYEILDRSFTPAIRPANVHRSAPGVGYTVLSRGGLRLGVINLLGASFMDMRVSDPFDCLDAVLDELKADGVTCSVVDFHAEATGEKRALGFYADGRISALIGTHTHVPTADAQILPKGTAYITDVGMTGPIQSVLGVEAQCVIKKLRTGLPVRFTNPSGPCSMCCAVIEIDNKSGKAVSIESYEIK